MTEIDGNAAKPAVSTTTAHVLYVLHALAPFSGWTLAVVAVIIGMAARDAVRGTYVESHYAWLGRTFWWGLLWLALLCVTGIIMVITVVLIPLALMLWAVLSIWYIYRVIRGWLLLNDGKPAPS